MDKVPEVDRQRARRAWPLPVSLFVAACFIAAFAWFASEVREGETVGFDTAVRDSIHAYASDTLTRIMTAVSFTGKVGFLVALGSLITVLFLYLRKYRWLVVFLVTMAGEILLELELKALYMRQRPEPFFNLPLPESYSFPSGHALGAFCFYGILTWLVSRPIRDPRLKILTYALAGIWIFLIGLSRVYLGVHYPSDVLAGYLAGMIWTVGVVATERYLRPAD
jgi:undecaprenyl-diphosphatase